MTATALVVLTLAGHTAGAGALPGVVGIGIISLLSFALTYAVSDRRRSFGWLLGYLLAAQVLLHVLLTFTAGHAHEAAPVPLATMLVGHACAALLATVALAYGNDLLDRWATYLGHVFRARSLIRPSHSQPSASCLAPAPALDADLDVLLHHVERRGPPVAATATAFA
jgi:hypothetical protein